MPDMNDNYRKAAEEIVDALLDEVMCVCDLPDGSVAHSRLRERFSLQVERHYEEADLDKVARITAERLGCPCIFFECPWSDDTDCGDTEEWNCWLEYWRKEAEGCPEKD